MATQKSAAKAAPSVADLFVSENDVVASPRGRKAVTDPVLVEAFANLSEGQAVNLGPIFGRVEGTKERQKIGTVIRRNWSAARQDDCRIDFHPETGAPQVRIKAPKA